MKYAIVIPDGCADEPLEALGGRTPLQAAHLPNMDRIARLGVVGRANNVPDSLTPASDVATLSLFGYDPLKVYTGRAPLETAAMGIHLGPYDYAIRCNLIHAPDGTMKDFTAGHISSEDGAPLIQTLQRELGGRELAGGTIEFHPGVQYRNILVWREGCPHSPSAVGPFEGFCRADEAYRRSLLDASQYHFLPRSEVETDPNWLQLIPYVLLVCEAQVFHYRRGASGTEARLRALRSVGIGGHISEADAAGGGDPYLTGMHREVSEEVTHAPVTNESWLGFIFDPRTPVGSVHLGVVHIWELAEASAVAKETALANAGFAPLAELMPQREQFETWSQFVFDELSDSAR